MPTYAYACEKCGHEFEMLQSITAKPLRKCPACGKAALKRLIGAGAGIIFKGSGFYATDYRAAGYQKAAQKESGAAKEKTGEKKEAKTESKTPAPAAKSESSAAEKKKSA